MTRPFGPAYNTLTYDPLGRALLSHCHWVAPLRTEPSLWMGWTYSVPMDLLRPYFFRKGIRIKRRTVRLKGENSVAMGNAHRPN